MSPKTKNKEWSDGMAESGVFVQITFFRLRPKLESTTQQLWIKHSTTYHCAYPVSFPWLTYYCNKYPNQGLKSKSYQGLAKSWNLWDLKVTFCSVIAYNVYSKYFLCCRWSSVCVELLGREFAGPITAQLRLRARPLLGRRE